MNYTKPILVIAGPTASGKSTFALHSARQLAGEIISVDSVQIYRGLDVGSAKVSAQERNVVPHHLIDIRPPDAAFNVAKFLNEARPVIDNIQARGKHCVVCAGTTQYLTALIHGLVEAAPQNESFRKSLDSLTDEELHAQLEFADKASAERLHKNDRNRIVRALEVVKVSGRALSDLHLEHSYRDILYPALIIVLCWNRQDLYARINQRSENMLRAGLLEETRGILSKFPGASQALKTVGYAQARDCIEGRLAEQDVMREIAMQTRRYAKRQMTFWRNEPIKRGWLCHPAPEEEGMLLENSSAQTSGKEKPFKVMSVNYDELILAAERKLLAHKQGIELWYVDAAKILNDLVQLSL